MGFYKSYRNTHNSYLNAPKYETTVSDRVVVDC